MKKQRKIDWVICAAGSGTRFKSKGIDLPKPNIVLRGKTFLERSISCLDILPGDQVIIITQETEQVDNTIESIKQLIPWATISHIRINGLTKGQLDTFYKAKKYIRKDCSVAIWNCDTYFKSSTLSSHLRSQEFDGIVPCGEMPGDHWSFFTKDNKNIITEAKEKQRISPWASVGFYLFTDATTLLKQTKTILDDEPIDNLKEHYVSSLYPSLIAKGQRFLNCPVELFMPFGTPEEVTKYWGITMQEFKGDNRL